MALGSRKIVPPNYLTVIALMNLVRADAEVDKIEEQIKRDPNVGFRLLRFVNSAALALPQEIKSFRQAVTIVGYTQLYKWLSVMLLTSVKGAAAVQQVRDAVTRARAMELMCILAHRPREDQDEAFLTGVFAMLDRVIGLPLHEIIEQLQPSPAIEAALRGRPGLYRTLLEVARLCGEDDYYGAAELATPLGLGQNEVTDAFDQARNWAAQIRY